MNKRLSRLVKNDSGATAIEYGLIAGLVAVVLVTALSLMGGSLKTTFTGISTKLDAANTAP